MRAKQIVKILVDLAMLVLLPLLMSYSLLGETAHEWLGIGITALFLFHHLLNMQFYRNLVKGCYTPVRMLGIAVNFFLTVCMLSLAVSGMLMSRHAVPLLSTDTGLSISRILHLLGAYWGMIFMSFHVGMHGSIFLGMVRQMLKVREPSVMRTAILRLFAAAVAGYGIYALLHRDVIGYLFLKNQYVFLDYSEPIIHHLLDYSAIILLFAICGYYAAKMCRAIKRKQKTQNK